MLLLVMPQLIEVSKRQLVTRRVDSRLERQVLEAEYNMVMVNDFGDEGSR